MGSKGSVAVMEQATQEVEEVEDLIQQAATEIIGLSKDQLDDLIVDLHNEATYDDFRLGIALMTYNDEKHWQKDGHESFQVCVADRFGIEYRKARWLIQISRDLINSKVPWTKVEHLGWTKLKELSSILTPENVDEWLDKIDGMTVLQIAELVKKAKTGNLNISDPGEVAEATKVKSMTFKVHPDQEENIRLAIETVKAQTGTEVDAVALDAICTAFNAGSNKPASLKALMKKEGLDQVLAVLDSIWPDVQIKVTLPE